jgi:hypothetical protein
MHRIADDVLFWSIGSAFGALMGFVLWLVMTWCEWRKIGGNSKLSLREFVAQDASSIILAFVASVVLYFAIPSLGTWEALASLIGFKLSLNYISALVVAYCSSSIAMKIRNISRRISDDPTQ